METISHLLAFANAYSIITELTFLPPSFPYLQMTYISLAFASTDSMLGLPGTSGKIEYMNE